MTLFLEDFNIRRLKKHLMFKANSAVISMTNIVALCASAKFSLHPSNISNIH